MIERVWRVARTVGRRLAARFVPTGAVLLYHRVAPVSPDDPDPFRLRVAPERFAAHLDVLRELARPATLEAVASSPEGRFAVTFDDAYVDVLRHAAPALEAAAVPATAFATDHASGPFWWDRLTWAVRLPERLADRIELELGGERVELPGGDDRDALLRAVHRLARPLDDASREALVEALRSRAGAAADGPGERVRPMTPGELREWAGRPGLSVGSHTASHRPLAGRPPEDQRREIVGHRAALARRAGCEIATLAYPYGLDTDFDRTSVALAREAGYRCACTAETGAVTPGADPHRLPRIWVEDWDAETFRRRIAPWLAG